MPLSQKPKGIFYDFFFKFSKLRFNFEDFRKEDDSHSIGIFELTDSEKHG